MGMALPPGKRHGTHCIRGWVGPMAGLDGWGNFRPTGTRSPDRAARNESLYWLSYPGPPLKPSGLLYIPRNSTFKNKHSTLRLYLTEFCVGIRTAIIETHTHTHAHTHTHTQRKLPALHNSDADVFGPVEGELRKFKLFAKYKENQEIFEIF